MPQHHTFSLWGDPVEVLVSSKSTRNAFCVQVQTCQPGGGPPPHRHEREDELFQVVEGEFELFDGERWSRFEPGELKHKLRGQVHAFRNCGTTTGKMLLITTPGGLDEYLEAIAPLALPPGPRPHHRNFSHVRRLFRPAGHRSKRLTGAGKAWNIPATA